ncbi:MAG TPA: sporulation integral membrane protein YtvI [Bacillota bacterium]|nr:sporulation integral membrane protein YtvI [Bacillota bacterium]
MPKILLERFWRFFLVLALTICIYAILKFTLINFYPFVLAACFAYFLNPIVTYLTNRLKLPRALITSIVVLVLIMLSVGSMFFIIAELLEGAVYLAEKLPEHFYAAITIAERYLYASILPLYEKVLSFIHTLSPSQQETIRKQIEQFTNQVAVSGSTFLKHVLLQIPNALSIVPASITLFIVTCIATFLMTNDWPRLQHRVVNAIPDRIRHGGANILISFKQTMGNYLKGELKLVFFSALLVYTGLLVLRIDYALTITCFIAIIDLFPFIGTGILFIPWILYMFMTAEYAMVIGLSILYMSVIVQRQLLEPKIRSASVGLSPLAVLFILFFSLRFWGILGLFISPVLLILLGTLHTTGALKNVWRYIKG